MEWVSTFPWVAVLGVTNATLSTILVFVVKNRGSYQDRRKAEIDTQEGFAELAEAHKIRAEWAEKKAGAEEKKRKAAEANLFSETKKMHDDLKKQAEELQQVKNDLLVVQTKLDLLEDSKGRLEQELKETLARETEKDRKIEQLVSSISDMEANWAADKVLLMEKSRIVEEIRGVG